MGYYMRGDYYRGDYYRGDLFSGIGNLAKKGLGLIGRVGSVGASVLGNTPVGLAGKAISHFTGGGGPPSAPGKALGGGVGVSSGNAPIVVPPGGVMRGYHLNKSKLGPSRAHPKGAAPHTVLVRNRHMNAANPRALARASRRAHGFLRMASKFVRYYRPKAPKGRAYIGKRRRSR